MQELCNAATEALESLACESVWSDGAFVQVDILSVAAHISNLSTATSSDEQLQTLICVICGLRRLKKAFLCPKKTRKMW